MFLSDPQGTLSIQSNSTLNERKQGSLQATFLHCHHCDEFIAVVCSIGEQLFGAVNAQLFQSDKLLSNCQSVSPKHLNAKQKLARWEQTWMPVFIHANN